ncbi:MAG: hypothetical protein PF541_00280 [Prolixibacteraceae bacterium]|jgi:hypothetical protein|nr:hypothetical protein [Prolixibacteraceae bacterium]
MSYSKPKCSIKCGECFFHYINECIATPRKDYFKAINEKQAQLIVNNKNRFKLSKKNAKELLKRFPAILN